MLITIEPVDSRQDRRAAFRIREQVFEREMGIAVPRLDLSSHTGALHLLARVGPSAEAAGVLSIVDTSGDGELHSLHGLALDAGAKVARYTQLAVLSQYRGMNVPMIMMLEAHGRFVEPQRFSYTWLLFDAERVASSFLCRRLGFIAMNTVSLSEYGRTRALVRDENQPSSIQASIKARQYVEEYVRVLASPQGAQRPVYQGMQ